MKKPSKDFSTRLAQAKQHRQRVRPYIEEIMKFCSPERENDFTIGNAFKKIEASETFSSFPEEMAMDLGSDLVTYFTPAEVSWASYDVMSEVTKENEKIVKGIVTAREDKMFSMIETSNYNDIAPQWGFEAATHGTPAMWITHSGPMSGMFFEVVPPNELLVVPGHRGYLDRFREMRIPGHTLEAALSMPGIEVDLSSEKIQKKMKDVSKWCDVVWGFWLDWSDPAYPKWMTEVTVDDHLVTDQKVELGGIAGSCPLVAGRFNPQLRRPWGRGAGWKALRDIRTADKIEEIVLSGLDQALSNTLIYPDDSFLDLSEGLEPGRAYPAHRGFTRDQIYEMNKDTNLDLGFYTEERFEQKMRTAFYQDQVQRGDTPPSATQYVDERRRIQRRIGKPSAPLWSEMIIPMIQRIEQIAIDTLQIEEALSHNGQDIKITPISPLQKAQNADEIMVTRSNLELGVSIFGESVGQFIDPTATFQNIVDRSGDKLLVIKEPDEQAPADPSQQAGPPA